ncbi:MAG: IPT/TIG domain-containing protein [Proteobacteria bacterium]|nr:IPT/TIG domain-containing protein [Pseudomonadota bacterium]
MGLGRRSSARGLPLVVTLAFVACENNSNTLGDVESPPAEAHAYAGPTIHSFEPLEASYGATLTIYGSNFSTLLLENSVTLNEVPAEVLSAEETELTVEVPQNKACTGPIRVTTTNPGGDKTATSTTLFTYVPTVRGVSTFVGYGKLGFGGDYADGKGIAALFYSPTDIAIDVKGNLYVADSVNHCIRVVTPEGVVGTFAGRCTQSGYADGAGSIAQFHFPRGLTMDAESNLYVADEYNHRIRKVTPQSVVSTFAGSGPTGYNDGGCVDAGGDTARFNRPSGVAIDSKGNLYVADEYNHRIRLITPDRVVRTLAGNGPTGQAKGSHVDGTGMDARFNHPVGIVIDAEGNLYVADSNNSLIRKLTPAGVTTTFAGSTPGHVDGLGMDAQFKYPAGIAIDAGGNLYIADTGNSHIRRVKPSGAVDTLAGGLKGYADGTGNTARFSHPAGIAIDAEGNLYVADTLNHRIRKITLE